MKFGANLLLFGDTVDEDVLARLDMLAEMGFDGAEVPVFEPETLDAAMIRRRAHDAGMELTVSGALPEGSSFHGSSRQRDAATRYVEETITVAAELGSPVICGPLYKAVGDTEPGPPLDEQRQAAAEALKPLADAAADEGIVLALEPLNRFETDLINTADAGVEFCRQVDSPGVGVLMDTFHMHIEEKHTGQALRAAGSAHALAHFHASENDRGVAGTGQVRWPQVAAALRDVDYDGWVVLETFNQANEAIRRAVSCWRPFYPSEEEFLREGLSFVRNLLTRNENA
jgi:D-psicose/D-tagatose/L-ribulose 3-epimerase